MSENFWLRMDELPDYMSHHLMLTVIALGAGVLVSVPTAILLTRKQSLRYPVLTVAGVIQTIPSLALLALMVPIIDKTGGLGLGLGAFGFWPAVIALTLYSILPILRNTVTGILGVQPSMIEAARGLGMSSGQILTRVQLPLAAPVIIAGIRTSTVWVVGIATLATPVGQTCLGHYIFTGLQTQNWLMVMFGVVAAAVLAILLDSLIGVLQKAVEDRRRLLEFISIGALVLVLMGGVLAPTIVQAVTPDRSRASTHQPEGEQELEPLGPIRIGAKTFTEQYILARILHRTLEEAGFEAERVESLGSNIVFEALSIGDVDVYVDYSGTIWANYMKQDRVPPPWHVFARLNGWLVQEKGVRNLGSLGFENSYALAMRQDRAEELGIRTIVDLASHAQDLRIGGDYEFFGRPEWTNTANLYGLQFEEMVKYDSSIMYQAVYQGEVDVISAFSSDGRIAAYDLVVLEDTRNAFPPYDAILLLGERIAGRPDVVAALAPLIGAIPITQMRQANHMVDRDEESVTIEEAAKWLREKVTQGGEVRQADH